MWVQIMPDLGMSVKESGGTKRNRDVKNSR